MNAGNLALWQSVEKTDPQHTKQITGKPYKGNSPKPYWIVRRATETFGPCGIGWGIEIVNERVEDGAPGDKVHIAHIRVWYVLDGKRGVVEHVGQTMFCGKNKNGPYTDEDAPKKSVTDALVKALSMVGFAGDIFLGRYDDSKYVQEVGREFADAQLDELTDGRQPVAKVLNRATGRMVDPNSSSQQKKPGGPWDTLITSLRKCEDPGELCTWYLGNQAEIGALNATMKKALAEEWQKGIRDDLAKCLGKDDVLAWKALWERDIASLAPYAQMLVTQEYEDRLAFFGIMREAAE
jgi:hypothetical protein